MMHAESSPVVTYLRSYLDKTITNGISPTSLSAAIDTNVSNSSSSMSTTVLLTSSAPQHVDSNLIEEKEHAQEPQGKGQNDGWEEGNTNEPSPEQKLSSVEQMSHLDRIFKLIYDPKHTKQGVDELREFLEQHSEAQEEFEKRLSKASKYFQSFIRRKLSNISGGLPSSDKRPPPSDTKLYSPVPRNDSRTSYRASVASFEELLGQQSKAEPGNSQNARILEIQRMFGFNKGSLDK
ncbi:hypothetical protein K7432_012554 [Basidiobolus ranarum]|uniref:Uncharacterized protein n=1 Tax=Basidiobolus ranarum TaxID=34480 RepID=A0ABR2VS28_9FUNG